MLQPRLEQNVPKRLDFVARKEILRWHTLENCIYFLPAYLHKGLSL